MHYSKKGINIDAETKVAARGFEIISKIRSLHMVLFFDMTFYLQYILS